MDLASLLGFILCFAMLIFGILSNAGIAGIPSYLDAPSALITFGGSIAATMMQYNMNGFIEGLKSFSLIFKMPNFDTAGIMQ